MNHLAMVRCPNCGGGGEIIFHKHVLSERVFKSRHCDYCDGSGRVRAYMAEKWQDGELMRLSRLTRGLSLRQEAKRLGITPEELDRRENGRIK